MPSLAIVHGLEEVEGVVGRLRLLEIDKSRSLWRLVLKNASIDDVVAFAVHLVNEFF